MVMRCPVCAVVGHVDHGKSSILDSIRGSCVVKGEAGAITQSIGASIIPLETIKQKCGTLLTTLGINLTIPGLLFIDTPGHAAFSNLRKRGGNLADIAVLVIDINEGFKPQTYEALNILKTYKTPFIVAANKIDLINGWVPKKGFLMESIKSQPSHVQEKLDIALYELVAKFYEEGFEAERFDRVRDYTRQIAIVPCSAYTYEGLPELLMVLTGLAQKYLNEALLCDVSGRAKGTILEVKEDKGIGKTLDVIIYDGHLKIGDTIVIGGFKEPIQTKIRALLQPAPLAEMRDKKTKFITVKEVYAATGVKIAAPYLDNVIAGMPIRGLLKEDSDEEIDKIKNEVQSEVNEVLIDTDKKGIVVKADSLGSLEALVGMLKEKGFAIKQAQIGDITKKDIAYAQSNLETDPLEAVVVGFNVNIKTEVPDEIKVIVSDIIYRIIEELEEWQTQLKKQMEMKVLENITMPCKLKILEGYVFRQSNPAVVGVEILAGKLSTGTPLMKDGKFLTRVKSIQSQQESLSEAEAGSRVAVSLPNVSVGRQVKEDDVLYSHLTEEEFITLKKNLKFLKKQDIEVLKEISEIMRLNNPLWGV